MKTAIDGLRPEECTSTGEGIFTALQAIASVDAVMGGGDTPAPAHIVLESDGAETIPRNPDDPRGAYSAARSANDQGVDISTISFGTPNGVVGIDGQTFHAGNLDELKKAYAAVQQHIGWRVPV